MKRVSYALISLGFSSFFCMFFGLPMQMAFLSALFTVSLSALQLSSLSDIRMFFISIPLLLIPLLFNLDPIIFGSAILGYAAFIFIELIEGKIFERIHIEFRESMMDLGFTMLFLIAILI